MPIPIGTVIQSGANLAGTIIGAATQGSQNKKNKKFAREMYDRQRQDALADRDYENSYNSPASQMARYKEAGLNPNLIYGQSNEGATVRSSDFKQPDTSNPGDHIARGLSNAGDAVANMYNLRAIQAQTDNLAKQNEIMEQDRQLRAAQVAGQKIANMISATRNSRESLDFHQQEKLNPISLQAAQIAVAKTATDIQNSTDANKRAADLHPGNLRQQVASIAQTAASTAVSQSQRDNIIQNTKNLQKEETLKQLEINLRKIGVNPNDPAWQRMLGQLLSQVLPDNLVPKLTEEAKKLAK